MTIKTVTPILCSFALILMIHSALSSQEHNIEISDTSFSVIEQTQNVSTVLSSVYVNKQADRGEIFLGGNGPRINLLNLQIGHKGGNELGLDGDVVPFSSVTFDLGNNVSDEHWDQVVASTFVTYMPPPLNLKISGKVDDALSRLNNLNPVQYSNNLKTLSNGFIIEELNKYVPEVLVSRDYDYIASSNSTVSQKTETGIDYNAFIPLLVSAIQEQQEAILNLTQEVERLSHLLVEK